MADKKKAVVIAKKEWTLMFYFASDNPLAPAVVSQLKALKNAGYHHQANVLAYFDPETVETPVHIFDVNVIEKLIHAECEQIGFNPNDPFVRNLMLDKLWGAEKARDNKHIRTLIQGLLPRGVKLDRPKPPRLDDGDFAPQVERDTAKAKRGDARPDRNRLRPSGPERSLETFLNFCADNYPAKHYMLFILGHGLVVGDDVFLFDAHAANHSLTLRGLGDVLKRFKNRDNVRNAEFELVSFHSCSMSSLEIASQLEGTAKFMLASQGTTYVGSWPYLSILIRIFDDLEKKKNETIDVKETVKKIFFYIRHNSTDFLLAGYSFDLCLCELSSKRIKPAQQAIRELAKELRKGLAVKAPGLVKDCILLAHWKSQSYWQENYTDMYDFCFCLDQYCRELGNKIGNLKAIQTTAGKVMDALRPEDKKHREQLVVMTQFVGPASQYSHGLSVFFPWSEPSHDRPIMEQYRQYTFDKQTGWLDFLKTYFGSTMRESRKTERDPRVVPHHQDDEEKLREDMAAIMLGAGAPRIRSGVLASINGHKPGAHDSLGQFGPRDPLGQVGPRDPMGSECTCGSIKNFPHDIRPSRIRAKEAFKGDECPTLFSFRGQSDPRLQ